MKKILLLLAVILTAAIGAYSQAPGIFNYQGVARNSVGNVLINQAIALRLTIHDGTAGGPVVYQEVRGATTNPFGLFNAQVGSAGFTSQTGTIAGVPWGVGNKYIQVEIDPNGGSSFINIGTAQIASVPYSLYTSSSGDLVLPYNKTQSDAGTLFKITNSGAGAGSTSLEGLTNSLAANVSAIIGTVTTASAGSFSAGVKGINNGNAGFGIGVWGTQNGSGWGVYGVTPSGLGVFGSSTSGIGVQGSSTSGNGVNGSSSSAIGVFGTSNTGNAGRFDNTNAANTSDALQANTNGAATSWALRATSTGAQGAGFFVYNNPGGNANAVRVTNNGSGSAISALATNSGSAGTFTNTNAANTATTLSVASNSTSGSGILSNMTSVTGQVSAVTGFITTTTAGSAGILGADFSSGGASGIEARTYGVVGQTGTTGVGVGAYANSGGTALRALGGGGTGYALNSNGRVQLAGIGENLNWILRSDAVGNATWANPAVLLGPLFWATTGNAGTVDGTNFIGTTDNVPFNIRVNNQKAGRLDQIRNNTFLGLESGAANYIAIGSENTGIGVNALNHNTTGSNNTGIGSGVLSFNTTGSDNTGTGRFSLYNNTTGGNNSAHGREALITNISGSFNTGNGWDALYSNISGNNNTGTGAFALVNNTTGSNNSGFGNNATVSTGNLTNATAIGANAQVSASNSLVLGSINGVNGATADVNVGIGNTAPISRLHVTGSLTVQDGTQGVGKLFFDNGAGVGTGQWVTPAAAGIVTGSGVATRVAFWNSASSISSNANLFWDNTNSRLGIGTAAPNANLDISNTSTTIRGAQVINSSAANNSSAIFAQTNNITSASFFEGSAITGVMPLNVATTMLQGATTIKGIASTAAPISQFSGIGLQGASASGFGIVGNSNSGTAIAAINWGTGYGLYTFGKLQFEGQGAATNRIMTSNDANGNATWNTLTSIGGVSGSGTTNFVPKWTPDGFTLGNSMAFDNGVSYSIGSTTPTTDIFYVSNPAGNTFATINQVGAANSGGLSFTRANAYKYDIAMNATNDFYIQNYTSGSTALTILGANANVGINRTNPTAKLDVNGTFRLTDGTQGANKVLTSDAAGNASWIDPSLLNNVQFRVKGLGGKVIPNSVNTDINTWDAAPDYNDGGGIYNAANGTYTVSKSGVYQVNARALWNTATANGYKGLYLMVNGGFAEGSASAYSTVSTYDVSTLSASLKLAAGAVVKLAVLQITGANQSLTNFPSGYDSVWSLFLIR